MVVRLEAMPIIGSEVIGVGGDLKNG